ncbi:MAG: helix-turn-helix transcriptional regulator, partial [Bacteroidaceae bacterium]|nr:helix-turn-helix transcriptional regulator [Bacteroidaceae bacterium]
EESRLAFQVLSYVEENYKDGELTELAGRLHFDVYWLSREIKRITGYNYTDLIQAKRLTQAAYLLSNTKLSVLEVAAAVGYENASYFHRIFRNKYGCSPKKYRTQ